MRVGLTARPSLSSAITPEPVALIISQPNYLRSSLCKSITSKHPTASSDQLNFPTAFYLVCASLKNPLRTFGTIDCFYHHGPPPPPYCSNHIFFFGRASRLFLSFLCPPRPNSSVLLIVS